MESISKYGYSEIHTIAAVGNLEEPNVTEIAKRMKMTKGAISKIIKKLQIAGAMEAYQKDGNKQKVFYSLTDKGQFLYGGV